MTKEIPLTQGKVALVDDEDYERLNQFKWCAKHEGRRWYAYGWKGGKHIRMHREIMDAPDGPGVDHINGDGLDNRLSNRRISRDGR